MRLKDIPAPEIYMSSADFRKFLEWFSTALEKTQYDTENMADLYDPLRCPEDLLWVLADTMGYKFDDRLPAAFNRLVLLYFMSMIYNRGSRNGMILAAETNLAQFGILADGEAEPELYNRLENTAVPTNSVSVTPHTAEGYIDVVYFSDRVPKDACIEYVRPLGMYTFQRAGVEFSAKSKVSIDVSLTNLRDIHMDFGPTQVGHYRRSDYASLQKMAKMEPYTYDTQEARYVSSPVEVNDEPAPEGGKRYPVWSRNPAYEKYANSTEENPEGTQPESNVNPGYRALQSLQLANNENVVRSLLPPIFTLGYGPLELDVTYPDDYYLAEPGTDAYNLRYDIETDHAYTRKGADGYDIETIDESRSPNPEYSDKPLPMPAVNPIMERQGDGVSLEDDNSVYMDNTPPPPWDPYLVFELDTTRFNAADPKLYDTNGNELATLSMLAGNIIADNVYVDDGGLHLTSAATAPISVTLNNNEPWTVICKFKALYADIPNNNKYTVILSSPSVQLMLMSYISWTSHSMGQYIKGFSSLYMQIVQENAAEQTNSGIKDLSVPILDWPYYEQEFRWVNDGEHYFVYINGMLRATASSSDIPNISTLYVGTFSQFAYSNDTNFIMTKLRVENRANTDPTYTIYRFDFTKVRKPYHEDQYHETHYWGVYRFTRLCLYSAAGARLDTDIRCIAGNAEMFYGSSSAVDWYYDNSTKMLTGEYSGVYEGQNIDNNASLYVYLFVPVDLPQAAKYSIITEDGVMDLPPLDYDGTDFDPASWTLDKSTDGGVTWSRLDEKTDYDMTSERNTETPRWDI